MRPAGVRGHIIVGKTTTQRYEAEAGRCRLSPQAVREEIARRAYLLYIARDRRHGADLDDWLQAERQFVGEQQIQPKPRAAAKRTTKARSR